MRPHPLVALAGAIISPPGGVRTVSYIITEYGVDYEVHRTFYFVRENFYKLAQISFWHPKACHTRSNSISFLTEHSSDASHIYGVPLYIRIYRPGDPKYEGRDNLSSGIALIIGLSFDFFFLTSEWHPAKPLEGI